MGEEDEEDEVDEVDDGGKDITGRSCIPTVLGIVVMHFLPQYSTLRYVKDSERSDQKW